jgi:hypothetical protein
MLALFKSLVVAAAGLDSHQYRATDIFFKIQGARVSAERARSKTFKPPAVDPNTATGQMSVVF